MRARWAMEAGRRAFHLEAFALAPSRNSSFGQALRMMFPPSCAALLAAAKRGVAKPSGASAMIPKFLPRVREFIERHRMLRAGQIVGVAVSGGADSVALLRLCAALKGE